jgi:sialate O-acetylesterase
VRRISFLTILFAWGAVAQAADPVATREAAPVTLAAQCPPVFDHHAVFQQGLAIPVWGQSLPGAKVTVLFGEQTGETVAGADGRWRVALAPMRADKLESLGRAPEGRTLTILTERDGKKARTSFTNILIGEVWLCSGQSNMAGAVKHNRANQDPNDDLMKSDFPAIRQTRSDGAWILATPPSVAHFTRVGFCFAREVQRHIKVPIGLINASTGGSRIESWMRIPPGERAGDAATRKPVAYGGLYRKHIAPLVGYGLRGALWYQGEANAGEGYGYFPKMESLINDWRASWGLGAFPFYFVQLAGIGRSPADRPAMGDGRARIREAQRRALALENTGMAVAVDIGADKEHPANKVEVGIRLAQWALHNDYGRKDILPSGPLYRGCKVEGNSVRIFFDHADGLMVARKTDYVPPVPAPGERIAWLSIQAKDGRWHWAEGTIDGEELLVSCRDVAEPAAVRYAYTQRPIGCYLYNRAGLPASPFTTEGEAYEN